MLWNLKYNQPEPEPIIFRGYQKVVPQKKTMKSMYHMFLSKKEKDKW